MDQQTGWYNRDPGEVVASSELMDVFRGRFRRWRHC